MGYRVSAIKYNSTYRVIGKHPDGRIFAVNFNGNHGFYVLDRDLNLITTIQAKLPDGTGVGSLINECVFLSTGTMICWAIYRTDPNQTVVYRSTDNTYTNFEVVLTFPKDITFIEKSMAVSTKDDTLMCCEYTMNPTDPNTGLWTAPNELNVWRGTNDGKDWSIVHTRSRLPKYEGDKDWIRHFHTVRYDPYEDLFWITTGDWYHESSIASIKPDGTGYTRVIQADPTSSGQQERTTSLMFTDKYIWYGSDSFYNDQHYMARISRETRELELLPYLPNDCTRLSDKVTTNSGTFLIVNKSYEKSPTNSGTTELIICDDYETGEWYTLYSWNVSDLNNVSVFYQLVDNQDGRIFVHARGIIDDTNTKRTGITAIIDVVKEGESELTVTPQGKMVKVGGIVKYTAKDKDTVDISDSVNWKSSNMNVATVDEKGVVTTLSKGITEITCEEGTGTIKKAYLTVMSPSATYVSAAKFHVGNGEVIALPVYDPDTEFGDTRWRFETPDGIRCFKLTQEDYGLIPTLKVSIDNKIKNVQIYE